MSKIIAFFTGIVTLLCSLFSFMNTYKIEIDTSKQSEILPNAVSNINIWNVYENTQFTQLKINEEYNIGDFVEYVQLMQCSGGNASRDLFVDPYDFDTLDDYDFSPLIANCRGILELGAKPHLKLGSVPLKYSSQSKEDNYFGTNIYPPDDYDVYYNYIHALATALIQEFGRDEVITWRFGVMTEYENADWFKAPDGTPESSAKEFCKLYDYTVAALQDAVAEDVFVGAHSMTVSQGLWDEQIFINHCGNGTNYKTGEKGSRICFLSTSFYDMKPGEFTQGRTMPECIEYLKECAEKAGLENLIFGVDEGRIYGGNSAGTDNNQLLSRTVGHTYQAAYDARLYKQLFDIGGDYLSSWYYLSGGLFDGNPTVSWHVASNIAKFAGTSRLETEKTHSGWFVNSEVDAISSYDSEENTIHIMAYNFRNKVNYKNSVNLEFTVNAPEFDGQEVTVTTYMIDDDCNFFDEWVEDRKTYGIGDDCFAWSPDDPVIEATNTLSDENARKIYFEELNDKYSECSKLVPVTSTQTVENGVIELETKLAPNGVVFYEITCN